MPTIADLNQRHPSVDSSYEEDLEALYRGDQALEKRLAKFLLRRDREKPETYALRCKEYHYRNYLGAIVDYFAAMLFTSKPSASAKHAKTKEVQPEPNEFYARFREDCDRQGGDVDAFFKDVLTDAMVFQRGWFSLELPVNDGAAPTNRAEFEKRKLGDAWLNRLGRDDVYDWETDETGNLAWVLTHAKTSRRSGLGAKRTNVTETWEHYQADKVDVYAISYDADKAPDPEKTDVPLIGSRQHNFGTVPVVCLELPIGLWAANRLRTPQLAHFRAINAQSWSLTLTCYAMAVAKVNDPAAFAAAAQGAGYGMVIGTEESWEWEAPPTQHFAALDTEIKAHKDEIFRIAHQMALGVENNAAGVGRTAESKSQDAQSTRVILTAYGRLVKEKIELVYDMISAARGDELAWQVGGLDDFAGVDTGGFVAMCAELEDAGGIPSKAFNADLKYKLATSMLPDTDEARKELYRKQIEENTPDPADEPTEEEKMHALAAGLTGKNAKPGRAGAGSGAKPPPFAPGGSGGAGAAAKQA